ncbi:hypothetical protein PINS_up010136 [Pythium insidiosum]|nr:hypothetical protein PINS_up010136 [Pythium insidiosum]
MQESLPIDVDVPVPDASVASSSSLVAESAFSSILPIVLLPLDLVRVRLQTQGPVKAYSSIAGVFSSVASTQGIRRLWTGVGPAYACSIGRAAEERIPDLWEEKRLSTIDATYEYGPRSVGYQLGLGIFVSALTHPFGLIQARMQYQRPEVGIVYKSSLECAKATFREGGARGLFRGLTASLVCAPILTLGTAIPILSFRKLHPEIERFDDATLSQQALMFAPSAVAFAVAQPFDVIATRLQAMPPPPSSAGRIIFRSIRDEARSVIAQHGVRGLYAGMLTSGLAVACSAMLWIPFLFAVDVYEASQIDDAWNETEQFEFNEKRD